MSHAYYMYITCTCNTLHTLCTFMMSPVRSMQLVGHTYTVSNTAYTLHKYCIHVAFIRHTNNIRSTARTAHMSHTRQPYARCMLSTCNMHVNM